MSSGDKLLRLFISTLHCSPVPDYRNHLIKSMFFKERLRIFSKEINGTAMLPVTVVVSFQKLKSKVVIETLFPIKVNISLALPCSC